MKKINLVKLTLAAEKGDRVAQCALADYFSNKNQDKKSNYWFKRIVSNSKSYADEKSWAYYSLGLSYDKGRGVVKAPKKAVYYYKKAGNFDSALLNLGICYAQGKGVGQNFSRAIRLYKKAAKLGNKNAAYNLALYYSKGRGIAINKRLAQKWRLIYKK